MVQKEIRQLAETQPTLCQFQCQFQFIIFFSVSKILTSSQSTAVSDSTTRLPFETCGLSVSKTVTTKKKGKYEGGGERDFTSIFCLRSGLRRQEEEPGATQNTSTRLNYNKKEMMLVMAIFQIQLRYT